MNKIVKCAACGESYNLDLDKYGGKKIRCKRCQAVIAVPTAHEAQDEFEVVEDNEQPVSPLKRMPDLASAIPAVPSSVLQRHRMASQRGAVNIALLQRNEGSREEIREAFLSIHSSKGSRLPDSIVPMIEAEEEVDERIAESEQSQEKLNWLKDVLSRALTCNPNDVGSNLTKKKADPFALPGGLLGMYKTFLVGGSKEEVPDSDEGAFQYAVRIVGRPVREMPTRADGSDWSPHAKAVRAVKIDTIKAAIEISDNTKKMLLSEKAGLNEDMEKEVAKHSQHCRAALNRSANQIDEGKLSEATLALQDLQRTAPVEMLASILVLMSQCAYLSGNASNSARLIQDAICFGASAPVNMDEGYNDLWAKSSAGLPRS